MMLFAVAVFLLAASGALAQTEPATCGTEETALFVMHIFDVSRSHENDMNVLIPWLTNFEGAIESRYGKRVSAVASFSDKPQVPLGDPRGDYCYREDKAFSEFTAIVAANGLTIRSGRDWKESQLEAMERGLESGTIGWEWGPTYGELLVQRVVIVKTDALPHEAGDFNGCTGSNCDDPCLQQDYPTFASAHPDGLDVDVIFVVTGDVYSAWRAHTDSFPRYHTVRRGGPQEVTNHILEILCSSTLTEPPTAAPTDVPTEAPTEAPLEGCGEDNGVTRAAVGGLDEDCSDICGQNGYTCDPVRTAEIQTDLELCRVAIAANSQDPDAVVEGGVKNEDPLVYGCNGQITDVVTAFIREGPTGCSNSTPAQIFWRHVCCCSL